MMRTRGINGPFFQRVGNNVCARSLGNFIATGGCTEGLVATPVNIPVNVPEGSADVINTSIVVDANNADCDPITWNLAEPYTWVSLSQTSGTGRTNVVISIDPSDPGFPASGGVATIVATAAGASNSPINIQVNVSIVPLGGVMLTEDGDYILTEAGDHILLES
jgi:hypothetical protein